MEHKDFCDGVKILLARMETNPEDFDYGYTSTDKTDPRFYMFYEMMNKVLGGEDVSMYRDWRCLYAEEQDALVKGFKNLIRKRFSEGIMRALMDEPKEKEVVHYPPKKFMLNPSQIAAAKKMGMSPAVYAAKIGAQHA